MNIFKRTYTAEDVTKNMTAMMLVYLNEMQKCVERRQMSDALVKEKSMLQTLGLHNTKNAQLIANHEREIAQYNANIDCFKLMTEAWRLFGNDVMIVRYDQFMQLLEKYNLVCGDLSRYKGYIPEKNLHEIARIKGMEVPEKFAVKMDLLKEVKLSHKKDVLIKAIRFPYKPENTDALRKMGIENIGTYNLSETSIYSNQLGLSSALINPFFMSPTKADLAYRAAIQEENERRINAILPRFFIAAPAQEMEQLDVTAINNSTTLNEYRDYDDKKEALKDLANIKIQTKDPFFCSCTEYGVLIYSKWGGEAQDEIIKRYEQLSQTVNN